MATPAVQPGMFARITRIDLRHYTALLVLLAIEAVIFLSLFAAYFVARGMAPDRPALATDNAMRIVDTQKTLGFFWEPAWHEFAMNHDWLISAANFTYNYLHLPLIFALGVVFFFSDTRKYRVVRNTLLLAGFMAVPFYWLFPVTPPRLLDLHGVDFGFFDTIGDSRRSMLSNDYAAVPSFHFGWILLVVMGVWWCYRQPVLRMIAVAFLAWMTFCIVVTSNHYFLDMALGGAVVVIAFVLALRWERFMGERPDIERKWFFKRKDVRQPF